MGWSARTFPAGWRPKIGPISPDHLNVGTRGDYMQPCLQQRNMQARDARHAGAVRGPSVLEGEVRGNSARAIGGVRRRAAHDQVVDDTFMHPPGLKAGHPRRPVQSSTLPGLGNVGIALNSRSYHRNAG